MHYMELISKFPNSFTRIHTKRRLRHSSTASLITMPYINQALLQFIDVMTLVDVPLHFLYILQ